MAPGCAGTPEPGLVKEELNGKERGRCLTETRPGDQEERGTSQHLGLTLTAPISGPPERNPSVEQCRKKIPFTNHPSSGFGMGNAVSPTLEPLLSSPVLWAAAPSPQAGVRGWEIINSATDALVSLDKQPAVVLHMAVTVGAAERLGIYSLGK